MADGNPRTPPLPARSVGTGFLPQPTQPRAWGSASFTQLPEGMQVSRCWLESKGRNSGQHWTGGAPFQPGLCFSLGTGHQGRPGSHLALENWVPDPFLKKQPVLWGTVELLSLPECEAGQESSSRTSPGVSSWHPQQGAWHASSQELFPVQRQPVFPCWTLWVLVAAHPLLSCPSQPPREALCLGPQKVPGSRSITPESHQNILEASAT